MMVVALESTEKITWNDVLLSSPRSSVTIKQTLIGPVYYNICVR